MSQKVNQAQSLILADNVSSEFYLIMFSQVVYGALTDFNTIQSICKAINM